MPHRPIFDLLKSLSGHSAVRHCEHDPAAACLCPYCVWMEIKHGSAAGSGKPGKMLASTAAGVRPRTHTQGSYQHKPVAARSKVLQLDSRNLIRHSLQVFFSHFAIFLFSQSLSFSGFPFAAAFRSFAVFSLVFSIAPHANMFPSANPHHLLFLPFSAHLCFFPCSHPFLLSALLMPVS